MGIGEIEEEYESLDEPISFLMSEIKKLPSIFKNKMIKIDYYFAADLKVCLLVTGLKAANSNFPCLYCHCKKDMLHVTNCPFEKRSSFNERNESNNLIDFGYAKKSLLGDQINFDKVIICTLHLRLRIFDVLLKRLIKDLALIDNYDGNKCINFKHIYFIFYKFFKSRM